MTAVIILWWKPLNPVRTDSNTNEVTFKDYRFNTFFTCHWFQCTVTDTQAHIKTHAEFGGSAFSAAHKHIINQTCSTSLAAKYPFDKDVQRTYTSIFRNSKQNTLETEIIWTAVPSCTRQLNIKTVSNKWWIFFSMWDTWKTAITQRWAEVWLFHGRNSAVHSSISSTECTGHLVTTGTTKWWQLATTWNQRWDTKQIYCCIIV